MVKGKIYTESKILRRLISSTNEKTDNLSLLSKRIEVLEHDNKRLFFGLNLEMNDFIKKRTTMVIGCLG